MTNVVGSRRGAFDYLLIAFFVLACVVMVYPFWHTIVTSLITFTEYAESLILLWPRSIDLSGYQFVIEQGSILRPLQVTIFIAIVGTACSLLATTIAGYVLSKRFRFSALIVNLILITMFVHPGLIPTYINYRNLGLLNTLAVYIVNGLIIPFYFVIMRTYYLSFPTDIEDAAEIDGCSVVQRIFLVVIPLSKAILAAIGLFFAVQYWNTFSPSLFFIRDQDKKTIQEYLFRIISRAVGDDAEETAAVVFPESVKAANILIATVPIVLVYPFLQKHFVKGVMLGALKG